MRAPGTFFLRNVVERRSLIFELVRRDFVQRYVGSAAGWLWGLAQPLVLLASWTFVFEWCLKTPAPAGVATHNYTLWLFCGFLPWLLFQETVTRSAPALVEHASLITKTVFPAEIVPLAVFLSSLVNHLLALGLVVAVLGVWLGHLSFWMLTLPLYMIAIGLMGVGIGWVAAGLQVYLRDTAQVLAVALTFWFWTTPIFIDESRYPARLRFLLRANPFAYLVRAYRDRLLTFQAPALGDVAVIAAYSIGAFVAGGLIFRHLKRGFADVL